MEPTHKIAVLAGDGIGKEVMPEGLRVLEAAARRHGLTLQFDHFEWASCDYYERTGAMMPDDWKSQLQGYDAIYFGAVGWPERVPDHVSLWGSLLKFRREFDQYINLRPVRLFEGVPCPLAGRQAGDIDFFVVRENTEGEYTNLGGRLFEGTDRELVIQESVFTRKGTDRVLRYAFELARSRARRSLTVATKAMVSPSACLGGTAAPKPSARNIRISPWTSNTSTSFAPASSCSRSASMSWWHQTCSAISSPTSARPAPARSAWRRPPT